MLERQKKLRIHLRQGILGGQGGQRIQADREQKGDREDRGHRRQGETWETKMSGR